MLNNSLPLLPFSPFFLRMVPFTNKYREQSLSARPLKAACDDPPDMFSPDAISYFFAFFSLSSATLTP